MYTMHAQKKRRKAISLMFAAIVFMTMHIIPTRAQTEAEYTQWSNTFLSNGTFNTSATGFPSNYTFKVTSNQTEQNATNVATITKELFHAIKESGKTVTLLDNCAAYRISPKDVADIASTDFSQTVQLGSHFRTGTTYAPVARDIAKNYQVITDDDQYLMGGNFIFWQIYAFPSAVLSQCTIEVGLSNAGKNEGSYSSGTANEIAERFHGYASQNSLYAYTYASLNISLPTLQKPTASTNSSAVVLNATGARQILFSNVDFEPNDTVKTAAAAVVQKINGIPSLATAADTASIEAARTAYEALTYTGKALVNNYSHLSAAEIEAIIAELPSTITMEDAAAIYNARQAYNAISTSAKALVDNYAKLTAAEVKRESLKPTIRVACVGDSITKGSLASNLDTKSYPAQLQAILGLDYHVQNFGVGGSTLLKKGDKPYWDQTLFAESTAFNPNIVIIMLGTNDAKSQNWLYKDEFSSDLTALVNHYRVLNSHPTVYIATSPTAYENGIGVTDDTISGQIIPIQKAVAQTLKCAVIDINAMTKNNPSYFADGIHPNDGGYLAIANTMSAIATIYSNADLAGIEIDGAALPGFQASKTSYTVILPKGTTRLPVVTAKSSIPGATVAITQAINVNGTVTILVTAEDKKTTKTYTLQLSVENGQTPDDDSDVLDVMEKINKISSSISLDDEASIKATREAYDALTAAQQERVTNYFKLTEAEKALDKLQSQDPGEDTPSVPTPQTGDTAKGWLYLTGGLLSLVITIAVRFRKIHMKSKSSIPNK